MGKYAKTIAAAIATAAITLQVVMSDGTVTASEWITVGLAALGAVGVYAVPNTPPEPPREPVEQG